MRKFSELVRDMVKKPPFIFPFIALFHILGLGWVIWTALSSPYTTELGLSVLWMLVYTIGWLAVCDLRKWGAWLYIAATVTNMVLYLVLKSDIREQYMSNLFLADALFSFFILFFYKRLE